MAYLTVFSIAVQVEGSQHPFTIKAHDVSPSEAVQKFLKEIQPYDLTPDEIGGIKAEFKEISIP